jgi:hypothetical protein
MPFYSSECVEGVYFGVRVHLLDTSAYPPLRTTPSLRIYLNDPQASPL